ncbi:MAG: hypothetical protein AB1513_08275 [Pseudomonadota bacterium]
MLAVFYYKTAPRIGLHHFIRDGSLMISPSTANMALAAMVQRARRLDCRVDPCLHHFQDEEIVGIHQPAIRHPALEVGVDPAISSACMRLAGTGVRPNRANLPTLRAHLHYFFRQLPVGMLITHSRVARKALKL